MRPIAPVFALFVAAPLRAEPANRIDGTTDSSGKVMKTTRCR